MKTPTKKQRDEVRGLVQKWRPKLYLHQWAFDIEYMDIDDGPLAETHCMPQYFSARIAIFPKFWSKNPEDREETIVHEMCHSILSSLQQKFEDLRDGKHIDKTSHQAEVERTTSHIVSLVLHQNL